MVSLRNFFYDTEFLDDGKTIELISIGIVNDDNLRDEYYAVNADMDVERVWGHEWLRENVWPQLPVESDRVALDRTSPLLRPKWVIANEVRAFIAGCIEEGDTPVLWADYAAYDHVVLAQLWGPMSDLPAGIPMWTHDIRQLIEQVPGKWAPPKQLAGQHDALQDARHNRRVFQSAMSVLAPEATDS